MKTDTFSPLARRIRETIRHDPVRWALASGIKLRPYQKSIALAVKKSIIEKRALTFVVVLPRQSGKNEVQRHLFAWLLFRSAFSGGSIVSVSPTFKPQTINAMDRVRISLDSNIGTRGQWRSSSGFIFRFHRSRLLFFSGEPTAKVVGATADLLLSVDEAQDIDPAKFAKDFDPMTASTNATRIFWGTIWTSDTLLSRQLRIAREEEKQDGIRRVFFYDADDIGKVLPSYKAHVKRVLLERGRQHPLVKTQYFSEEIDSQAGMFPPARLALMLKDRSIPQPIEGHIYAFLIDVAGQDESPLNLDGLGNPGRDSTTLCIVEIDLSSLPLLRAPTYRIAFRVAWTGASHLHNFAKIKSLADHWKPAHFVIDATGVGEGLWSMLDHHFPTKVIPVKFTQQVKSELGWRFLAIIETGRFKDCAPSDISNLQYKFIQSEILPGPSKILRWGVKDGTRSPSGELIHDDFVIADALVAALDELVWSVSSPTRIVSAPDPLKDMSSFK